jgi:hypothetical protein
MGACKWLHTNILMSEFADAGNIDTARRDVGE